MAEPKVVIEVQKSRPKWYVNFADFANMVKAFIGSNYLSVAYAFLQSGLLLGIGGILLIAGLTDHCCHLIVKTKHHAIRKLIEKRRKRTGSVQSSRGNYNSHDITPRDSGVDDDEYTESISPFMARSAEQEESSDDNVEIRFEEEDYYERLLKHTTYGDIGNMAYGSFGLGIVNFCIALTQFGFCVGYSIFIGNTVHSLFPVDLCYTNNHTGIQQCTRYLNNYKNDTLTDAFHSSHRDVRDLSGSLGNYSAVTPSLVDLTTEFSNMSTIAPSENITIPSSYIREFVTRAPNLMILVASPLPVFIVFSFIRSVRYLGVISVFANLSILFGCVSVLGFLIDGFEVHKSIRLAHFEGFPVFFGMVTGAFEGIGLVIPIESSMEGNRHLFSCFLHGAIAFLLFILGGFGIMGYLKFGEEVHQMLNTNIPSGNPVAMIVNIGICIGILLTFPLQIFPVIEIIEKYLFMEGRFCGPKKKQVFEEEKDRLLTEDDEDPLLSSGGVGEHVPTSVPSWKRNLLRIIIVVVASGLAVVLKDNFAYVGAFVGAVGSSCLAYILPCLFHMKICWNDLGFFIKVKDVIVVVFGVIASVVSVISVIQRIVQNTIV